MSVGLWFAHGALHAAGSVFHPVGRVVSQATNYVAPTELPDVDTLMDLAIRGWISGATMTGFARLAGVAVDPTDQQTWLENLAGLSRVQELWNTVYLAKQSIPTEDVLNTLSNRGLILDASHDWYLEKHGFADIGIRDKLRSLRFDIPSSSDLVRFSVRHVFEPDLIHELGYNQEFKPILDMWHRFQGLNYPIFTGPFKQQVNEFEVSHGVAPNSFVDQYGAFDLTDPTWAQAFWWSHWVLPSPTQGYEMFFRLRPDRNRDFDPPFARDLNFGLDDLNLLLRGNDYPPKYRPLLAAIAHRIPGIRFLRQLRATNVFGRADVVDLLRRQGYSEGDAEILAESVERNNRDTQRRAIEQQAKGQLAKYWELGIVSRDQYVQLLLDHGLAPEDAQSAAALGEIDLQAKRVEKIVIYVHRQFVSGVMDAQAAGRSLIDVGVTPERSALYVADWQMELKARHREVSASKAVKWACQGLISLDELSIRLGNLGYDQQDTAVLRAEATLCASALAGKAASALEKRQRQQIAALKAQQREAARGIQAARRQLASHGTPAQLRKWFCEGHLGETDLYARLRFLQWPDDDIARLVGDCKAGSPGQQSGKPKPSTGGGTVPG